METENTYIIYSPQYLRNHYENCKSLRNHFIANLPEFLKNEGQNLGLPDHIFIFQNPKKLTINQFLIDIINDSIKQQKELYPERLFIAETYLPWFYTDTYKNKDQILK
ncbi:hypothetical protein EHQ82_16885 [Leptospira selangorensis]|uniref:Uncharacterized protein n=1 Tax=Leptospira selangorensis TaxID=2484982 RepID=A0ABY2N4D0_9LEPT|nr:hypothetical protein [Leptospira selangorensis]TGM16777.1 hypothetical protein EHQ82_16885 [Leptospira selangorensis]